MPSFFLPYQTSLQEVLLESTGSEQKEEWKHRDLRTDVWGNNCRCLSKATRQLTKEGTQVMRQEAQASADKPWNFLADMTKCRRNGVLARSASHYQPVTTALESCMAKTFEQASSVHQLCLWNHMSSGNDGNLPHHETIIFLWKKEIKFFIWAPYPSFIFLYFKKICITFCT